MPKQKQVNTESIVNMYTVQHLACESIGRIVGMSRVGVWKRLQVAGVTREQGEHVNMDCFQCGSPMTFTRARWRNSRHHFCSEACYFKHIENPAYNPNRMGQRMARRIVSKLFDLKAKHVVHHDDSDTTNNIPSNLWVFASQGDHMSYHRGGDALPIWIGGDHPESQ